MINQARHGNGPAIGPQHDDNNRGAQREQYLRAVVAEILANEPHDAIFEVLERSIFSCSNRARRGDTENTKEPSEREYSAQEITDSRIVYLYEQGEGRYQLCTFQHKNDTIEQIEATDLSEAQLQNLVSKHFHRVASPNQLRNDFYLNLSAARNSIPYLAAPATSTELKRLQAEGGSVWSQADADLDDWLASLSPSSTDALREALETKLREESISLLMKTLASRYPRVLETTSPQLLRLLVRDHLSQTHATTAFTQPSPTASHQRTKAQAEASFLTRCAELMPDKFVATLLWPAFTKAIEQSIRTELRNIVDDELIVETSRQSARALLCHWILQYRAAHDARNNINSTEQS